MVARHVDTLITYRILNILSTEWEDLSAYKLGIIDENGKPLKKSSQLRTKEEKDAYTPLHRLVFSIKRMMNKVPRQARRIGTYAAALLMLREEYNLDNKQIQLIENAIANVSDGGNVAGLDKNPPGPCSRFRDCAVFDVDSDTYNKTYNHKKKYKRWKKYFGEKDETNEMTTNIHHYAKSKPKEGIIVREKSTGAMRFVRYPKK